MARRRGGSGGEPLMSAERLLAQLTAPDLKILDSSWHLPTVDRDARSEFAAAHIPGAQFFDIDEIADDRSSLPHMAPSLEKFASRMTALGVGDGCRVVVYDTVGMFSAPRVWWMLKYFGFADVSVLDGGMPAWRAIGGPIEDMPSAPRPRHFTPSRRSMLFRDVTDVAAAVKLDSAQIVDARAAARFAGSAPEPRPGLRAGHIPGAKNLPFSELLDETGALKRPDALRSAFADAGVDLNRPIITSCGSGVTAAIVNLALDRLGVRDHALYDGSWAEWGASDMLPIETG